MGTRKNCLTKVNLACAHNLCFEAKVDSNFTKPRMWSVRGFTLHGHAILVEKDAELSVYTHINPATSVLGLEYEHYIHL